MAISTPTVVPSKLHKHRETNWMKIKWPTRIVTLPGDGERILTGKNVG